MPKRLVIATLLVLTTASLAPIPAVGQGPEATAPNHAATVAAAQAQVANPTTPYFVAAIAGLAAAVAAMWRSNQTQCRELTLAVAKQVEEATKANAVELATVRAEHGRVTELERLASKSKLDDVRVQLDRERVEHRTELDEVRDRLDLEQKERRQESAQLLREQKDIMREVLTLCDGMRHVIDRNTEAIREVAARFPASG